MTSGGADLPGEDEVLGWTESLKNWGRWGDEDELGTLNLITPEVRKRGASLVREGIAVPLAWDLRPPSHDEHGLVQRYMIEAGDAAPAAGPGSSPPRGSFPKDYLGLAYHGLTTTHLDAPSHCIWDGKLYNGFSGTTVTSQSGARHGGVEVARAGFHGRAILLDVGEIDRGVLPAEVEELERRHGFTVEPGDMLLLRVGTSAQRTRGERRRSRCGGWQAAMLPWLRERDVALIGSDSFQEAQPTGYTEIPSPIHVVGLHSMGLWLIDNCDLEALAETCQRLERWEFQLSVQPLPIWGATGGPVAPIAMF